MTSYQDLLKQRDELEKQIQDARKRELMDAVAKVRSLVAEYGLTAEDVFPLRVLHAAVVLAARSRPNIAILKPGKPGPAVASLQNGFKTRTAANLKFDSSPHQRALLILNIP